MNKVITIGIGATMLAIVALSACVWYFNQVLEQQVNVPEEGSIYNLPRGAGYQQVIQEMSVAEIISAPVLVMKIYARFTHSKGGLKAGEYVISPGMSHKAILDLFRSGKVRQYAVTFPEGIRCRDWLQILSETFTPDASFDSECDRLLMDLGYEDMPAEGWLYPDTYYYIKGDSPRDLLRQAKARMQDVLDREWENRQDNLPLNSPYEALILASIVEKETGAEDDRALVASVFINRLRKGMRLQSDPTIIYGLKNFDGNLRKRHLTQETPYNTYVIRGLPPTPISHPGLRSLQAVLNPPETDYLYFVAKGNGRSYFSKTLEEHNRAVREYQINNRAKNYQSRPDSQLQEEETP